MTFQPANVPTPILVLVFNYLVSELGSPRHHRRSDESAGGRVNLLPKPFESIWAQSMIYHLSSPESR